MALTKIQTAGITDDAIDSDHYVDASIDNAHLADDAIDADKLASNSVVSASIVDGAIVNADINASAAIAASKIAGIPVANRNVMINGQFDVWQRGTSFVYGSMTAHNYYMDRFRHEGAAWTGSVTQQTFANAQTVKAISEELDLKPSLLNKAIRIAYKGDLQVHTDELEDIEMILGAIGMRV